MGRKVRVGGGTYLPYGELKGGGSRRIGCRESDSTVSLARTAESSSHAANLRRVLGLATPSDKNVSAAVFEVTSSRTWQEGLSMCNEYARTSFSEDVIVHRGGIENEADGCVMVGSLEHFRGQAVEETVGRQRLRHCGTKKVRKDFTTKECSL